MATPTIEELAAQVQELNALVKTPYQPPSGPEFSYPIVGQPMTDAMWQYVTLGMGDGVLDEGGQPYWLRARENANNTLKITVSTTTNTAQAMLRGFYHKMTEDRTFTVPGVTTSTLFHFCLTYSPVGLNQDQGPISLQMYAGTPPTTLGRFHIILWTLLRKPNQLLTDAEVRMVRPKITPSLSVNVEKDRPDPSKVLWGTRVLCHESGVEYRATGASDETGGPTEWQEVDVARNWTPFTLGGAYTAFVSTPEYRIENGYACFRGGVRRKDNGDLRTSVETFGWATGVQMAGGWYGSTGTNGQSCRIDNVVSGSSGLRDNLAVIAPPNSRMKWFSLDGLRIPLQGRGA